MADAMGPFNATLNTLGRRTQCMHSVVLLAVRYNGKLYFSRHLPDSDWFKNALANPDVTVTYGGMTRAGRARPVQDRALNGIISRLKYPGQDRAAEQRVSIEVTLCE